MFSSKVQYQNYNLENYASMHGQRNFIFLIEPKEWKKIWCKIPYKRYAVIHYKVYGI